MKLLALDPGGTTGFAWFQTTTPDNTKFWECVKRGIRDTKDDRGDLFELLQTGVPDIIVVENFKVFPWKSMALAWSLMTESMIIGACELYCADQKIPLHKQTTDNRDIGYKWGQVKHVSKSNPANHAYDAEAHGCFYIIKNGGIVRNAESSPGS